MGESIIGQQAVIDRLLIALLADGHVLMEGLPGLAKTRTIKTLAKNLDSEFRRIQFTPDLLPADVTGSEVYYDEGGKGSFRFQAGPIFGNLVLADEINRAPAKAQAALLEAMEERQVTVSGTTHPLPSLFLVMATQNPIEQEGTYPLPEAQTDRFLMKVLLGYGSDSEEVQVLRLVRGEENATVAKAEERKRLSQQAILDARGEVHSVFVSDAAGEVLRRGDRGDAATGRLLTGPEDVDSDRCQPARDARAGPLLAGARVAPGSRSRHAGRRAGHRPGLPATPADPDIRGRRGRDHAGPGRCRNPQEGGRAVNAIPPDAAGVRHPGAARRTPPQGRSGFSLLPRQPLTSLLAGGMRRNSAARGLDFEEIRRYLPGDDPRTIDWKVTARTRIPHSRVFTEERERPVLLLVDQRIRMFFGSVLMMKSVAAAEAARSRRGAPSR